MESTGPMHGSPNSKVRACAGARSIGRARRGGCEKGAGVAGSTVESDKLASY